MSYLANSLRGGDFDASATLPALECEFGFSITVNPHAHNTHDGSVQNGVA